LTAVNVRFDGVAPELLSICAIVSMIIAKKNIQIHVYFDGFFLFTFEPCTEIGND